MKMNQSKNGRTLIPVIRTFIFLFLASFVFAACNKDNDDEEPIVAAALNVVNASPGPLAVSFFLDEVFINGPALSYTEKSGYLLANTGSRKFDVTVGGTNQPILTENIQLEREKYYSVFITGENNNLSAVFTEDDLSTPPAGKARIRFINLSPDAGALSLGVQNGTNLFTGISFKTATEFVTIDPATYTIQLKSGDSSVSEASINLLAGGIYTVWARGLASTTDYSKLGLKVDLNN